MTDLGGTVSPRVNTANAPLNHRHFSNIAIRWLCHSDKELLHPLR